eukprot:TRINITY_DN4482_c0_g2_i3.p3 TRINITY_DN4482_c0_g2~~TRINITY_DN4482_c0_g2_i3.p3  ORF type:complete len:127 (+),score=20.78 TRINITY_DN4482_c0_g2_i3:65-445(+)
MCIRDRFISGSQDGSVSLWGLGKKKPVYSLENAHDGKWITSLGSIYNSDFFCSGSHNGKINLYKAVPEKRLFQKMAELPSNGVVNDIKISRATGMLASIEGAEHRLGRWFTEKSKNVLKLYRILPQ